MFRALILGAALFAASSAFANDPLPTAIDCYQTATNSKDINAYMACFAEDAVMIDVGRTFEGQDAIRTWALREVIKGGDSFRHREILEAGDGYAKTEVNWATWVVHYFYWWDKDGKITKMSLQYAD
ncbi:YybH family protein [Hoeflea poritis]|uniref:Nuclear transport factor 2 family protein n=1 Tax=Hoeflea poritis TaxID=2993659 RepID=A0ABT4VWQ4_9HYPH|nr:nuclear transport factor 2 family protein [Hoeflea poritis]MDA4848438.1 nuclear transport factor 2 family protein [Hoeflea poritis]